jgi:hypothetical protein
MSLYEYRQSRTASAEYNFYALLMAAMRNADTYNLATLKAAFPAVWTELQERYHAPGGLLPSEQEMPTA